EWRTIHTDGLPTTARTVSSRTDGSGHTVVYRILEDTSADAPTILTLTADFALRENALIWTLSLKNHTDQPLEIGDLAVPLPMNTRCQKGQPATASVFKHSFLSSDGSFLFWMRSNSVGPYLTLTPLAGSPLEYWDRRENGYRVFLHSAVAGE